MVEFWCIYASIYWNKGGQVGVEIEQNLTENQLSLESPIIYQQTKWDVIPINSLKTYRNLEKRRTDEQTDGRTTNKVILMSRCNCIAGAQKHDGTSRQYIQGDIFLRYVNMSREFPSNIQHGQNPYKSPKVELMISYDVAVLFFCVFVLIQLIEACRSVRRQPDAKTFALP